MTLLTLYATKGKLIATAMTWKETRKRRVKPAWKIISGNTNCRYQPRLSMKYASDEERPAWLSLLHRSIGLR